jgi:uncharacterized protein (TIGR00290 family)
VTDTILSWSGGKDSALALRALRDELGIEPAALLTTFAAGEDRVSVHGVRRELLEAQAAAAGLALVAVEIPAGAGNALYEERLAVGLAEAAPAGATVAFADLFLADIRAYREERMKALGYGTLFPVWGRETADLARDFIAAGFEATLVCVDPERLDPAFAGRSFDAALLADLPAGVDPCGENGEFHTFVHAGPILTAPIAVQRGETVTRDGFVFTDLHPADRREQELPNK